MIVVVGDVMVDVVVRTLSYDAAGSDTPSRTSWRQGGAAANTALWLARLGAGVTLIGRVGDDLAGRSVAEGLRAEGVITRLAVDPAADTGTVVALVRDGDRDMFTSRGAAARLAPTDLATGWLDGAHHLHLSGYVLLDAATRPTALAALDAAVAAGVSRSVDVASAAPLAEVGAEAFLSWLPAGTLVKGNAEEAAVLTGCAQPDAAARALAAEIGEAVVTCGRDGALWSDGDAVLTRRTGWSTAETGPVDPVGAGDAFTAGLLAARMSGGDIPAQLRRGEEVAARAVGRGLEA